MIRLIRIATAIVITMSFFMAFFLPSLVWSTEQFYTREEYPLQLRSKTISPQLVSETVISRTAQTKDFIIFMGSRDILIKRKNEAIKPLFIHQDLRKKFDNYNDLCASDDSVIVGVSFYPEDRKQKNHESSGSYSVGPDNVGILVINNAGVSLLQEFTVISPRLSEKEMENMPIWYSNPPDKTTLGMQDCFWNKDHFLVGEYGSLSKVDINRKTVYFLEYDQGMEANRTALTVYKDKIFVIRDAGGMASGSMYVYQQDPHKFDQIINIVGLSNLDLKVSSLFTYNDQLFSSSYFGIIGIDLVNKVFHQYKGLLVYDAKVINNYIYGARNHGFVRINIDYKTATHFLLSGAVSNNIYDVSFFHDTWYIANEDALFEISEL